MFSYSVRELLDDRRGVDAVRNSFANEVAAVGFVTTLQEKNDFTVAEKESALVDRCVVDLDLVIGQLVIEFCHFSQLYSLLKLECITFAVGFCSNICSISHDKLQSIVGS